MTEHIRTGRTGEPTDPEKQADEGLDRALRPLCFDDYVGQDTVLRNLRVYVAAARDRGDSLDHTLLFGPPGLGKTTLAQILSRELGTGFRATSGPAITKTGDLVAILTNLERNDVLFIDEIHRMPVAAEEVLYPAMEDYVVDIVIGEGPAARSVRLDIAPFTLVGATTRAGLLAAPLRDRFGIPLHLKFYTPETLTTIILAAARKLLVPITHEGSMEIARRARGTPRIALRLLRRVRDFAQTANVAIDCPVASRALARLEIDEDGLDALDRQYLHALVKTYAGGPSGADTLAAALSEARDTVEDVIEPYLMQKGYIARTPRGRVATSLAYERMGLPVPQTTGNQTTLLQGMT